MPRPSRQRNYEQRSSGLPEPPSALIGEDRDDANLSDNTPAVGKSYALDPVTAMFAQIIESSWELEDEEGKDECDAIGDDDTRDQSDAKGVSHGPKEIGYRLRLIADALKRKPQPPDVSVDPSQYIREVSTKIITSSTFEQFMEALPREAAKTIGWDQVALYSSIIHTSIMMVGVCTEIKNSITGNANQYFQSRYRDWINSQPRGWDSIFDEPIVD